LLHIWRLVSNRLFELYSNAAKAYFESLRIAGQDINASLRLLRLLAKHSGGLKSVLEDGLRNSSVTAWLEIVPQLFSRLHHPEPYVRTAITELLERIAEERQSASKSAIFHIKNCQNPALILKFSFILPR
jgi:PI-3-kinase-related kinase SMG-1